jgi:hypothetical protein
VRHGGRPAVVAKTRRNLAYIKRAKREVAVDWLRGQRHKPVHGALPRLCARGPRARGRRTRTATRRAQGQRAGQDPGDPSPTEGEGDPDGAFSRSAFDYLREITPDLSGAERLALFQLLPEEVQQDCWQSLADELEAARA